MVLPLQFNHPGLMGPDLGYTSPFESFFTALLMFIFIALLVIIIFSFGFGLMLARRELLNHWNVLIPNLSYSSEAFYQTLKERMLAQEIEGLNISVVTYFVGGILSHKRRYLRLTYDDFKYEVCAAPYGKSFFVSYWMQSHENRFAYACSRIPFIGKFLVRLFFPVTYYRVDTSDMFHALVHQHVLEMLDTIMDSEKLEKLSENQRIPTLKNIFDR